VPHEEAFDHAHSVPAVMPQIRAELCRPAALTVAGNAIDVEDCARLLDMLGLNASAVSDTTTAET
jgi:hypothetical protein